MKQITFSAIVVMGVLLSCYSVQAQTSTTTQSSNAECQQAKRDFGKTATGTVVAAGSCWAATPALPALTPVCGGITAVGTLKTIDKATNVINKCNNNDEKESHSNTSTSTGSGKTVARPAY